MKKLAVSLSILLMLSVAPAFAEIGENFAKGGISLGGSFSYSNNLFYFQDPTEQRKYWNLDFSPAIDYYIIDRLALTLLPWLYFDSYTSDPDNLDRSTAYGIRLGVDYALILEPAAHQGIVLTAGALIGFAVYPTVDDLVFGVETANNYARTDLLFTIKSRLYYFLNDRIAPYLSISPQFGYVVSYKDPAGAKVSLDGNEKLRAQVTISIGVSYFVPNKDATMFQVR